MPDYSFIARGLPPIDIASPLLQVEQIRQQRAAQAQRQQMIDLDQQAMGMRMADFANQRERQAVADQQVQAQAQARAELPNLEAAVAQGNLSGYLRSKPEWAQLADAVEANPQFADKFVSLAYQMAGVDRPSGPLGDPRAVNIPGFGVAAMQGDNVLATRANPAPQQPAEPPAGVRERQWFLSLTPEQQARVLEYEGRGKNSDPAAQKQAEQSASAEKAWNTYKTGRDELERTLSQSTTFPGAGLLPAMTEDAQTADAAYSAMAPILKSLFRVAGEGVFTDKDQALLLGMLPNRNTLPGARKAALENIDRIVMAKLGIQSPDIPQQAGPQNGRGGRQPIKTPSGATITFPDD